MRRILSLVAGLGLLAPGALAQAPQVLQYQGRLTTSAGQPVGEPTDLTFRIYPVEEAGTALHVETDTAVPDAGGNFVTAFGDAAPLDLADFGQQLWLGVTVDEAGGGSEMTPRIPLRAAPSALRASLAEDLLITGDFSVEGVKITDLASPTAPGDAVNKAHLDATTGDLGSLDTADTSSLVAAINELKANQEILQAQVSALMGYPPPPISIGQFVGLSGLAGQPNILVLNMDTGSVSGPFTAAACAAGCATAADEVALQVSENSGDIQLFLFNGQNTNVNPGGTNGIPPSLGTCTGGSSEVLEGYWGVDPTGLTQGFLFENTAVIFNSPSVVRRVFGVETSDAQYGLLEVTVTATAFATFDLQLRWRVAPDRFFPGSGSEEC